MFVGDAIILQWTVVFMVDNGDVMQTFGYCKELVLGWTNLHSKAAVSTNIPGIWRNCITVYVQLMTLLMTEFVTLLNRSKV